MFFIQKFYIHTLACIWLQLQIIECAGDQTILEAAEDAGASLPFDCRLGACATCGGKMVSGTTDNSEQMFLSDELLEKGFILTCASYPSSDCTILTNVRDDINALLE